MLASDIITPARDALFDTAGVRWSDQEMLRYASHAETVLVGLRPDAYSSTLTLRLAGGTLQNLSSLLQTNPIRLLRIVRNRAGSESSAAAGKVVRLIDRGALDTEDPNWHTRRPSTTVQHYMVDPYLPRTFYVYPPAPGDIGVVPSTGQPAAHVEATYTSVPPPLTVLSEQSVLSDQFAPPLIEFVLYRAFSKDASYAGNRERAQLHLQAFAQALGLNFSAELQAAAAAPKGA